MLLTIGLVFSVYASDNQNNGYTPAQQAVVDNLSYPTLYAPWRDTYSTNADATDKDETSTFYDASTCPFCLQFAENNDAKHFILERFAHHVVILNLFPYGKGHLLIVPYKHIKNIIDLPSEAHTELMGLIGHSVEILKKLLGTHGANIGINIERIAGAGIPDHLHVHVLPRWRADSSFIQVIGKTHVISWDLQRLYEKLKPAFQELAESMNAKK